MKPLFALLLSLALLVHSAEPPRLSVIDYFQKLPADVFEVPAPQLWRYVRQMEQGNDAIVDVASGYITCEGDGAQGDFTVVLFRYKDGQPLVAVCQGEPAETDSWFLNFYKLGANGKLEEAPRKIFPIADADRVKFELPRKGRTVLVKDTRSGKVKARVTWDGERFLKE